MDRVKSGIAKKYHLDPKQVKLVRNEGGDYFDITATLKENGLETGKTYRVELFVETQGGR